MAHRCWLLDEIVTAIAVNLVMDRAKASAVALASCSKSLEQPALGEVWRSLDSLAPLVQCFPPKIWKVQIRGKEKLLYFKRAPLQGEWTRFQKRYASKVRCLDVSLPNFKTSESLSLDALHLLQQYSPGSPLLPNLVSLDYRNEVYLHFISLFISPSLTSIDISQMYSHKAHPMIPTILNKLSTLSHIREITIHRGCDECEHDPSTEEAFSQLLMQCNQHLRICSFDSPISAAALRHTMQLPSLEEFWLIIHSFQLPDPLPTVVFPSLRRLDVECNDPGWLKLLYAVENPVLSSIKISCPGSAIGRFMETFQLVTSECGMHERLRELWINSPDEIKITPEMVACNFSFKNLTSLTLFPELDCVNFCNTADLTDDDIDLLTNAMPFLEDLSVGGNPCNVLSRITFKSIYTISHRCTRLTKLMIHFNPALFVTKVGKGESWDVALGLSDHETLSSEPCSVRTLDVGDIPLPTRSDAPFIMALGLVGVFPCLETIDCENGDWEKVVDLMGVCKRMGRSSFHLGRVVEPR